MWIRQILVAVVGLASGFAVAAGLFSFIIGLGVRFCRPDTYREACHAV